MNLDDDETADRFESGSASPLVKLLCLGWYDGPTSGLALTRAGRVYRFELLDWQPAGGDLRAFALAPLARDSWDRLVEAIEPYQEPRWPVFSPTWDFPTTEESERLDRLADEVLAATSEPTHIVSAEDLTGELIKVRAANGPALGLAREAMARRVLDNHVEVSFDWFEYLEAGHAAVVAINEPSR